MTRAAGGHRKATQQENQLSVGNTRMYAWEYPLGGAILKYFFFMLNNMYLLFFSSFVETGGEPRALPMLDKYSSAELYLKPHVSFEVTGSIR